MFFSRISGSFVGRWTVFLEICAGEDDMQTDDQHLYLHFLQTADE